MKKFKIFGWKKILAVALAGITLAGTLFGIVKLSKYLKNETKAQISNFDVGGLDENTGKYVDDSSSIYTKNSFDAKGLEVKLDFDSNISYQVFWYDSLGEFSHCSEVMTKGSKFYTPYKHQARIEITPNWDVNASEDEMEIKWYEVSKYANQLEIRVDKNQSVTKDDYTVYTLNSAYFTKNEGKLFSIATKNMVDNAVADCYSLTNIQNKSLVYVNEESILALGTDQSILLSVVTQDGDTVIGTCNQAGQNSYKDYIPLPTIDNPLEIPYGANLYISFTENSDLLSDSIILGLY